MRMFDPRQILMENEQVLLVYKPAGIAVQSGSVGQMDLEHQLLGFLTSRGKGREIPYLAVVHRLDQPVEGVLLFAKTKEAAAACSAQIQLMTGRHHQIRVQLSHAGMPIVGDRKYGECRAEAAGQKNTEELLLCAASLTFENPVNGKTEKITVSPKGGGFQKFGQVQI